MTTTQITRGQELAAGLRRLADFIEANPGVIASEISDSLGWPLNIPLSSADDPKQVLADVARAASRARLKVTKDFSTWASVYVDFGGVELHFYANRSQVCERVVVGQREVTKEIPDPAAPKITVTQTEDVVEWRCHPLLADATPAEATS